MRITTHTCLKCEYETIQQRDSKPHWCPNCSVKNVKRPKLGPNITIQDIEKLGFVLMSTKSIIINN